MAYIDLKYIAIEEKKGTKHLGLCRRGDLPISGKVVQEGRDAGDAQCSRMLFSMKQDVASNPESVSLLGAPTEMSAAAHGGHLVE